MNYSNNISFTSKPIKDTTSNSVSVPHVKTSNMPDSLELSEIKRKSTFLDRINSFLEKKDLLKGLSNKLSFNKQKKELVDSFKQLPKSIQKSLNKINITPENIELVKEISETPKLYENIYINPLLKDLMDCVKTKEKANVVRKVLYNDSINQKIIPLIYFVNSLKEVKDKESLDLLDRIYNEKKINKNEDFYELVPKIIKSSLTVPKQEKETIFATENIEKLSNQYTKIIRNKQSYVTGLYQSESTQTKVVKDFFNRNFMNLLSLNSVIDKETVDVLLRKRVGNAENFLSLYSKLTPKAKENIKKFNNATNPSGKPFLPDQKINFCYIMFVEAKDNDFINKISDDLDKGNFDLGKVNIDLFKKLLKEANVSSEKINNVSQWKDWDLEYIPMLSKSMHMPIEGNGREFDDILNMAMDSGNFKEKITNPNNSYGKVNQKTKQIYEKMHLDYEKWLNPDEKNNVHFVYKSEEAKKMDRITENFTANIEKLRQTFAGKIIENNYSSYIKDNKFVLPNNFSEDKNEFLKFANDFQNKLNPIYKKVEKKNEINPNEKAQRFLNIKQEMNEEIERAKTIQNKKIEKYDYTIKTWDRIPQKDLFQGNKTDCCIGLGGLVADIMPSYLLNTAFNMIEVIDNKTNNVVSNGLTYFVKEKDGNPAFVIDNIEVKNSENLSTDASLALRKAYTQYATNLSKDVTNRPKTDIYMGVAYNDVNTDDLEKRYRFLNFVGNLKDRYTYLDLYNGRGYIQNFTEGECYHLNA